MRRSEAIAGSLSLDRVVIASCVAAVTVLAWLYLLRLDQQMGSMEPMADAAMATEAAWTLRDFAMTFAMWTVMMVGMMAPSAMPVLLLLNRSHSTRPPGGLPLAALFGAGHFAVWIVFSALAASTQWALHNAALLSPMMSSTSSILSGAILIGAGIYQLTPAKARCLSKCQSPLGFVLANWRDGATGAVQLGIRHGLYCLGCCWALMAVLFVVGIMNLVWVAMLTAFILFEKFGPAGSRVSQAGGVTMILAGITLFLGK